MCAKCVGMKEAKRAILEQVRLAAEEMGAESSFLLFRHTPDADGVTGANQMTGALNPNGLSKLLAELIREAPLEVVQAASMILRERQDEPSGAIKLGEVAKAIEGPLTVPANGKIY
jgi:hypothetical protein